MQANTQFIVADGHHWPTDHSCTIWSMNYHITISIPYWFRTPHPARRFEPTGAADRKSWRFADWAGVSESRYVKRQVRDIHTPDVRRVIALTVNGLKHRLNPDPEALLRLRHGLSIHSRS